MALFAGSRRDLDAWATSLGVDNDDDASARLGNLTARVGAADELVAEVVRSLKGVRSSDLVDRLQRAESRLGKAYDAMAEALRGFYVHERGR